MFLRFGSCLLRRTKRFRALSTMNNTAPSVGSCPLAERFHDSSLSQMRNGKFDENDTDSGKFGSCGCGTNRVGHSLLYAASEQHQSRVRQMSALRHIAPKPLSSKKSDGQHRDDMKFFALSALVDSHCHLQLEPLGAFSESAVDLALEMGVRRIVVCGTEPGEDWRRVLALHQAHPEIVVPNFGLHPWWIKKYYTLPNINTELHRNAWDHAGWLPELEDLLQRHASAGVGECGLDKGVTKEVPYELQEAVLLQHFALAAKYGRVLTLHCVGCWDRLLALLAARHKAHTKAAKSAKHAGTARQDSSGASKTAEHPKHTSSESTSSGMPASIVLHSCASMPVHLVAGFVRLPTTYFSVSMGGRGNSKDGKITEKGLAFIRAIPADRLLLETDSPDQLPHHLKAPRPATTTGGKVGSGDIDASAESTSSSSSDPTSHADSSQVYCEAVNEEKGLQYNEPALLRYHCAHLAHVLGVSYELLAQQTTENAHRAFTTMARV